MERGRGKEGGRESNHVPICALSQPRLPAFLPIDFPPSLPPSFPSFVVMLGEYEEEKEGEEGLEGKPFHLSHRPLSQDLGEGGREGRGREGGRKGGRGRNWTGEKEESFDEGGREETRESGRWRYAQGAIFPESSHFLPMSTRRGRGREGGREGGREEGTYGEGQVPREQSPALVDEEEGELVTQLPEGPQILHERLLLAAEGGRRREGGKED